MTQDTRELVELAKAAVEFANLAAGEGLSIDGIYPEDFLMRYSDATGFEDWYNVGQHAATALTAQAERIAELEVALEKARAEAAPDDRSADMAECFMFSVGYEAGERDGRAAAIKQAGIQREKGDHNQAPLDQAPQPAGEAGQEGWRLRDWSDDSWQWEPTPQPSVSVAEALKPFADFASAPSFDRLPDDMPMTQGSRLARKQVTAGDFKRALVALRALKGGEAND